MKQVFITNRTSGISLSANPLYHQRVITYGTFPRGGTFVGVALVGSLVFFSGGLEYTGDGPQQEEQLNNVQQYLLALSDITVLDTASGLWTVSSLSRPHFGVAGAALYGLNDQSYARFAGGAYLSPLPLRYLMKCITVI